MPPLLGHPQIDVPGVMSAKQPLWYICPSVLHWLCLWPDTRKWTFLSWPPWKLKLARCASCLIAILCVTEWFRSGGHQYHSWALQGSFPLSLSLGPSVGLMSFNESDVTFCFLPLVVLLPWPLKGTMLLAKALSYWMMWLVQGQSCPSWTVPTATGGSMTAHTPKMWESAVPRRATQSWMAAWVTHLAPCPGRWGSVTCWSVPLDALTDVGFFPVLFQSEGCFLRTPGNEPWLSWGRATELWFHQT